MNAHIVQALQLSWTGCMFTYFRHLYCWKPDQFQPSWKTANCRKPNQCPPTMETATVGVQIIAHLLKLLRNFWTWIVANIWYSNNISLPIALKTMELLKYSSMPTYIKECSCQHPDQFPHTWMLKDLKIPSMPIYFQRCDSQNPNQCPLIWNAEMLKTESMPNYFWQ